MSLPQFVTIGDKHGLVLRLLNKNTYWRDAGQWGIKCQEKDGKFVAKGKGHTSHLTGTPLNETTKARWKKDNDGYTTQLH